ncbi:integral membrane protein 2B [Cyanistes caeruleus]|uniref:integral membrane protein 2B n=1 Tax=Cyanistes caeruleus TaxID=156563 RepID=UPI000CDB7748|nr:integral membrane protein 2B [Cyanistes caeruleus]
MEMLALYEVSRTACASRALGRRSASSHAQEPNPGLGATGPQGLCPEPLQRVDRGHLGFEGRLRARSRSCVGPAVGAGLCGRGRVVPAVPPSAIPPGRPAGPGRLLASSRTPDAPGQGSAWRGKLGVRPRLCRSVFAEPGGCVRSLSGALQDPEDAVPVGQRRAWCWCMCFGLAFMLAGVFLGGAYLYKYFAFQQGGVYFCGIKYIEDGLSLPEPGAEAQSARYHTIEQNIQILEEEDVEFISVPVPEFADSDPADIVHDFHRRLTAYLDLSLDKCYVIPLNTSVVMPPKNFLELLINIKAGTYLPQSYLIHEQMIVTDRIENVDQLGFFIYRLCRGKETYKLQRKETMKGIIQKREAINCRKIRHFENKFAMETLICEQ